jgi:hypothetical protein
LSALATAPRLFPEAPAAGTEPRLARGPLTLEERLDRDLGAALAGSMTRAAEAEARCGDCGSVLS